MRRTKAAFRRCHLNATAIVANDDGLVPGKRASLSHFCLDCLQCLRAADADLVFMLLEASDQFAATYFYMKDGSSIVGRVKNQDTEKYYISQNPFAPQQIREILKKDVGRTSISDAPSIMFRGLVNSLNPEELKDLIAYLKSGGNKDHEVYKNNSVVTR